MKKTIVSLFKADPTVSGEDIAEVEIRITESCSVISNKLTHADVCRIFDLEAEKLAKVLFNSLPQGVFDRVIVELMKKKSDIYFGKTRG